MSSVSNIILPIALSLEILKYSKLKWSYLSQEIVWLCFTSLVSQTVKTSAYHAGDLGLIPGSGRSSGEGNGNPLQYSCLENSMGLQRVGHDSATSLSLSFHNQKAVNYVWLIWHDFRYSLLYGLDYLLGGLHYYFDVIEGILMYYAVSRHFQLNSQLFGASANLKYEKIFGRYIYYINSFSINYF